MDPIIFSDTETIENDFACLRIREGILHAVYKPGTVLDLKKARQVTADRLRLQREKNYPVFVDLREVTRVERAARHYFAHEGSILLNAMAVLCSTSQTRAIVNFYIDVNAPVIPTRAFTDQYSALDYLKPFTR